MSTIAMQAEKREPGTKNDARRVRAAGRVPAVLYGSGKDPVALALDPRPLLAVLHSDTGHNKILSLTVNGGESTSAVIKDWQIDPVDDRLLHVDLKRIALDQKLRVKVPVHAVGEPKGVKQQGGILEFVTREVEIECLPLEIPDRIDADVTELVIGKNLRVRDLQVGPGITLTSPADSVVAHIVVMKEEEVKPAEELAAAAAPAEPEVIKKGKAEKEGEEGAAPEAKEAKEGKEGKEGKKK
jgi:large subunit ribosomal protein L25